MKLKFAIYYEQLTLQGDGTGRRNVARTPRLEGVGLSLPESTRLVGCSIATDHYLFQCRKTVFFGYLQAVGTEHRRQILIG